MHAIRRDKEFERKDNSPTIRRRTSRVSWDAYIQGESKSPAIRDRYEMVQRHPATRKLTIFWKEHRGRLARTETYIVAQASSPAIGRSARTKSARTQTSQDKLTLLGKKYVGRLGAIPSSKGKKTHQL